MAIYNSHIKDLKIVLKPAQPIFEGGLRVGDKSGQYAQFSGGRFETKDKDVIEKLEGLSTFNVDFWKVEKEEKPEDTKPNGGYQGTPLDFE